MGRDPERIAGAATLAVEARDMAGPEAGKEALAAAVAKIAEGRAVQGAMAIGGGLGADDIAKFQPKPD